jgi:hypothetical protein
MMPPTAAAHGANVAQPLVMTIVPSSEPLPAENRSLQQRCHQYDACTVVGAPRTSNQHVVAGMMSSLFLPPSLFLSYMPHRIQQ